MKPLLNLLKKSATTEDPIEQAIQKNPCRMCRNARRVMCLCKKAGSGGVEGTTSDNNSSTPSTNDDQKALKSLKLQPQLSSIAPIDFEALEGALVIDKNPEAGSFSLKLQIGSHPNALAEARKMLRLIHTAFNEFKKELEQLGLDVSNLSCESTPDNLIIHFPHPKYFDAFIEQLKNKNLLPEHIASQLLQAEEGYTPSSFNPFSIQPTPASKTKASEPEAPEEVRTPDTSPDMPSPFRTQLVLKNEPWN